MWMMAFLNQSLESPVWLSGMAGVYVLEFNQIASILTDFIAIPIKPTPEIKLTTTF